MASKIALMRSLQEKSLRAEQTLAYLKQQFEQLKKLAVTSACAHQEESYKVENEKLKNEVTQLRTKLVEVETQNGLKQVPLPENLKSSQILASTKEPVTQDKPAEMQQANKVDKQEANKVEKQEANKVEKQEANKVEKQQANKVEKQEANKVEKQQANKVEKQQAKKVEKLQGQKEEKATKKEDKNAKKQANQAQPQKAEKSDSKGSSEPPAAAAVDVSKLNMKIGKIVAVEKHPDADSLYVEQVDLGEGKNRTIISGLVKHVPIEQMQGRLAVFLTNLKPAKMRGIMSEGMIMCANVPEKVEIIEPPAGAAVGDRVIVEGYPGEPEELLNPKKKTWESIMPDLQANEEGLATYKGALWKIEGKGYFKAPTVRNGQIK